jgi:hypothetical protein
MFIITGLPLWGLVAYFACVLALNLASERLSFSRAIDSNAFLRRLDAIGRLSGDPVQDESAKTSPHSETNPE